MSKFKKELYSLLEKSYYEENEPVQLTFTNRIYRKYGDQFNKKYDYISGKNREYIAEKLKNTNPTDLGITMNSIENGMLSTVNNPILNNQYEEEIAPMMYIPEEIRKEWVELDTKKFFLKDENKRDLLEEYLSTLSENNRRKAIAVMCENSNSKNYYRFLDLSTTAYTENQKLLSEDLIKYFENKYLNEFIDKQETLQRYNHDVFSKQTHLENKETSDVIYRDTVLNQHYYNPYDKNEMVTPKVSEGRQFLDNQKSQDELFEIIDNNSKYYVKQQTEFNNDHLNPENVRNKVVSEINKERIDSYQPNNRVIHANNQLNRNSSYDLNNNIHSPERILNLEHGSMIIEIPKVDNIADFINMREVLHRQNTIRKEHNIKSTVRFNNELSNSNINYSPKYINNYNNQDINTQTNMHNEMGSVYNTNMNENMVNKPTTMSVAKEEIENNQQQMQKKLQQPIRSILNQEKNSYGMDQLDFNRNNKFEQVKNYAHQVQNNIIPNEQYFNNRFNNINAGGFTQQHTPQQSTNLSGSIDHYRMETINDIQKFFERKPAVVKKQRTVSEMDEMIIEDKIPAKKRKAEARNKNTKKAQTSKKHNQLVVKQVRINNGINYKQQANENKKVEMKKVLV